MKKLVVALIGLLFITICFPMIASGIKVWPGKLDITINKWYTPNDSVDRPIIQIINTKSYDIIVKLKSEYPSSTKLTKGYSNIPDLSWIKTYPDELYLPARSSGEIEVSIEVPEGEQSSYYNERWEAWIIITPPLKPVGGINVQTEIAVKFFIKTPVSEAAIMPSIYIFLVTIFLIFFTTVILFFRDRKKRNAALYYFKKKKQNL